MKFKFFLAPLTCAIFGLNSCASRKDSAADKAQIEVVRQIVASGDYKKAIFFLQPLAKNEPKNEEIFSLLGLSYLGNGNTEPSIKAFERVVELNNKNYDAKLNLSYALITAKKYTESRKVLKEMLSDGEYIYPEKVHVNFGLSYLEQNNCQKATPYFEKSLILDPTMSIAHFNLGKCAMKGKNFKQAIVHFQQTVDFCPNCLEPVLELAKAQTFGGQKTLAIDSLERLLKTKLDKQSEAKTLRTLDVIKSRF
jgi:Tfp pilus assembly protein PilF